MPRRWTDGRTWGKLFSSQAHGAPVAQLDRASGYEPEGREFESPRAHHLNGLPFIELANSPVELPSRFWVHLGPLTNPLSFQAFLLQLFARQGLPAHRFPLSC